MKLCNRRKTVGAPVHPPIQEVLLDPNDPATILEWQFDARLAARGEEFEQGVVRALHARIEEISGPTEKTVLAEAIRFYVGSNTNVFRRLREASIGGGEISIARSVIDDYLPHLPIMHRLDIERDLLGAPPKCSGDEPSGSPLGSLGLMLYGVEHPTGVLQDDLAQVVPIARGYRPA